MIPFYIIIMTRPKWASACLSQRRSGVIFFFKISVLQLCFIIPSKPACSLWMLSTTNSLYIFFHLKIILVPCPFAWLTVHTLRWSSPQRSRQSDKLSIVCDYLNNVNFTIRDLILRETYFGIKGATLISTTLKLLTPRTLKSLFTHACLSSLLPMRTVWHMCHELKRLLEMCSYKFQSTDHDLVC